MSAVSALVRSSQSDEEVGDAAAAVGGDDDDDDAGGGGDGEVMVFFSLGKEKSKDPVFLALHNVLANLRRCVVGVKRFGMGVSSTTVL